MLRFAAAVGAAAGAALAAVLVLRLPVWAVFTAMAGLGAYRGLYNPPLESIFADSIVTGQRCNDVSSVLGCPSPLKRSHARGDAHRRCYNGHQKPMTILYNHTTCAESAPTSCSFSAQIGGFCMVAGFLLMTISTNCGG
jgi:hypothetical protein